MIWTHISVLGTTCFLLGRSVMSTADCGALFDAMDDYVAYIARVEGMSPETVKAYSQHLEAYVRWCERSGIDGLHPTARALRAYLAEFRSAGYASRTVAAHLSALRSFFRWLNLEGIVEEDTVSALATPKLDKPLPHTLTLAELERLLDMPDRATAEGQRDAAMLEMFIASGARISELSRLAVDDINTKEGFVRLFGKGAKERIVPLYRRAIDVVTCYVQDGRNQLMGEGRLASQTSALFISRKGDAMNAAALRYRFDVLKRRAGISSDVTPHTMRHTFATELLGGGADLRSVQELLGHASLSTTQLYTHLTPDRLKAAVHQAHPRG